jgi:hypothetical protein
MMVPGRRPGNQSTWAATIMATTAIMATRFDMVRWRLSYWLPPKCERIWFDQLRAPISWSTVPLLYQTHGRQLG